MAEILGYAVEEMIGKNLFAFMDEEEIQNAERKVENRKAGLAETHESKMKHKDGHDVYVELKGTPITDD
jgi:PAS domain S-box-containing protein